MTPRLNIHSSNRLEVLSLKLASTISVPLPDVLQKEIIIVQSRGMARWLSHQLAIHHSICANIEFPFPRAFAYRIFKSLNADLVNDSPWEPEVLLWRVMRALSPLPDAPEFESVRAYALGENSELRLYQLAQKIAHAFDQYLVYRPELVRSWERGEENHWQALLWRELMKQTSAPHAAELRDRTLQKLQSSNPATGDLPQRISVFGTSVLPKFYLELFASIAAHCEVNFFLIQPTQESWEHITSKRQAERIAEEANLTEVELHLEEGHPLLASWGAQGKEFFRNFMECDPHLDDPHFIENHSHSILHQLQDDILHLEDRKNEKALVQKDDSSIQIHSCHSPIRELEVLRDQILDWFLRDPSLEPRDILVMMPDVEAYTPFIQAVFDVAEKENEKIPFSIADRSAKNESQIAETLLAILNLSDSRCTTREILALLDCRSLLARFDLTETDLERIRNWIAQAGIRWGIDSQHRASLDLPAFDQNSWCAGLDRLLLGYAMLGNDEQIFEGTLPIDNVEGSSAEILGRFVQFATTVFNVRKNMQSPRPLREWSDTLQALLNTFFTSNSASERELQFLRSQCSAIGKQYEHSGFFKAVPLSVIRAHFKNALESGGLAGGFLTGRVTFCAMKPMRSLPFKIICLLGMNDMAFPRQNVKIGFDLLQQKPKPGDPSTRKDDQYLFLETILAARERLHISYVGQSARDNKLQPPSVLVSELMDCLKTTFSLPDGPLEDKHLMVQHRLQAFSSAYFTGNRLFTFSRDNAKALQAQQAERLRWAPFISVPLSEPSVEFRSLKLTDLAEFFAHPAKQFLRRRLQLDLGREVAGLDEVEPFQIGGLDSYQAKQELLEKLLAGHNADTSFALLQARGILPFGRIGESSHRNLSREVAEIAQRVLPRMQTSLTPIAMNRQIGDFHLSGELHVSQTGLLQYRCAKIKGTDLLRAWINHLALNLVRPTGTKCETILIGLDAAPEFSPVGNAEAILQSLLDIYWQGMREPLRFFPNASHAYAKAELRPGKRRTPAIKAACNAWYSSEWSRGEEEDVWFQFCFRGTDPLDQSFEKLSLKIFEPLFTALKIESEVGNEL